MKFFNSLNEACEDAISKSKEINTCPIAVFQHARTGEYYRIVDDTEEAGSLDGFIVSYSKGEVEGFG
jgi:hypothetical protein